MQPYIPLPDCQHGYLYFIRARNFWLGVFNAETNGFVSIREKLGSTFLFTELHWDADPMFGTAQPIRLLEPCPVQDLCEGVVVDRTMLYNAALYEYLEDAFERFADLAL